MARLESVVCGRCGGTGHYSYCSMYGTVCFGCGGSGRKLTKRGRAAAVYMESLRMKKASEVELGEWIVMEGIPGYSASKLLKVETIETMLKSYGTVEGGVTTWHPGLRFTGVTKEGKEESYGLGGTEMEVMMGRTKAERLAHLEMALAYQETLTKSGTPKKRAA